LISRGDDTSQVKSVSYPLPEILVPHEEYHQENYESDSEFEFTQLVTTKKA